MSNVHTISNVEHALSQLLQGGVLRNVPLSFYHPYVLRINHWAAYSLGDLGPRLPGSASTYSWDYPGSGWSPAFHVTHLCRTSGVCQEMALRSPVGRAIHRPLFTVQV